MNNLFPPPSFASKPKWATGLCRMDHKGSGDLFPYYWVNQFTYQRCTSKVITHPFKPDSSFRDDLVLIDGAMQAPDTYSPYCKPQCRGFITMAQYHELIHSMRLEF